VNQNVATWNAHAFRIIIGQTIWMAGVSIKGGQHIGSCDEFGYKAADQIVWNHDVHASLLHLLRVDHKRLTFYFEWPQHATHGCGRRT
jgi:Protein of unknown function (DUF1501)